VIVKGVEQRPQLPREVANSVPFIVRLFGPIQHPISLRVLQGLDLLDLLANSGLAASHLHKFL
jgi:hypothetical protein